MERKSKKITAFLLAFLMILSVCLPSAGSLGLNGVNAESDSGYEENAGMDISNATSGDATTEAAQATTEAEYITTGNALTGMPAPIANENTPMPIAAGDDGLTVDNFKVKVNGEELKDGDTVQNGAPFEVSFDWYIENNSHKEGFEFEVDLGAENFSINNYDRSELKNKAGKSVGEWWIEDGKMHIQLNDDFVNESYIDGGANLKGTISAGKDGEEDQKKEQFKIGDQVYEVTVRFSNESGLGVDKSSDGDAYLDGGKLYQKFKIVLSQWNGKVTLDQITDSPQGFDMDSARNFEIKMPDGTTQSFTSFSQLNSALKGKELSDNQNIEITYEMAVTDIEAAMQESSSAPLKNTVTVDYKNNMDQEKQGIDDSYPNIPRPYVEKSGNVVTENGKTYVDWTITVDPGLFDLDDLSAVKDTLGAHLELADTSIDLDDLVEELKNGNGSYTYRTEVDSSILGSPVTTTVSNKVNVKFDVNGKQYLYEKEGYVGIGPVDILDKEAIGYDDVNKVVQWRITIHVPDSGTFNNVSMSDFPEAQWHQLVHKLVVDGKTVYSDGQITDTDVLTQCDWNSWNGIVFNDAYFSDKAGKDVIILIESTPTELAFNSLKTTLKNTVNLSYAYNDVYERQEDVAEYEFEPKAERLEKTGIVSSKYRNAADYTLDINLSEIDMKEGDTLTVKDILPEHMHLVGTPNYSLNWVHSPYWSETEPYSELTFNNDDTLEFNLKISKEFIDLMNSKNQPELGIHLYISYSAQVDKEYLEEMLDSGKEVTFHNTADLYKDSVKLGSAQADVPLKYNSVTSKTASYPSEATSIKYEIIVNPDALDLVPESDVLIGIDKSGDALVLKNNSVHIYEYTGNGDPQKDSGNWKEQTNPRYVYNQKEHEIRFTLPDEKPLKIIYEMSINLLIDSEKEDNLTESNSINQFSLYGSAEKGEISKKSWNNKVQVPSVWSNSRTGYITIFKFWTNDGTMVALDGSKFELYQCEWDKDKIINPKSEFKETLEVSSDGLVQNKNALSYDNIYALYEVQAKNGFICNDEPYFFALVDSSNYEEAKEKFPAGVDLYFSDEAAYIYYENQPSDAKLILQKKFVGENSIDPDALREAGVDVTFTVKDSSGNVVNKPYKFSDFEKNSAGEYELELDVAPGTYTVEETETTISGYILKSTTYTITTQSTGSTVATTSTGTSAKTGDIKIEDGDTVTAAFTNTYKKATGKLVLKKTIEGLVTKDEAEGKLTFTVTDESGNSTDYTLNDFTYDKTTNEYTLELIEKVGEYTVTESVKDIDGYILQSVTYTVDNSSETNGYSVTTDVKQDATTTVAFKDNYKKEAGKIVLKKKLAGDGTLDIDKLKEAVLAKDITFTLKNVNDSTAVKEYKLNSKDFIYDVTNHEFTLEADIPAGTYTVTETATAPDGYVLEETVYTVMVAPNPESKGQGNITDSFTVEDGDKAEVAFTNTYKKATGKLVLKKTIEGLVTKDEAEGKLTFTVTDESGNSTDYTLNDFTYDKTTNEYTLELTEEIGEYTITESVKDIDGYILQSVTYTVDNSNETNGYSVTTDVKQDEATTVAFKDDYIDKDNAGKLVIQKTIEGSVTREEAEGALEFTVESKDGTFLGTYTLDTFDYNDETGIFTKELDVEAGEYTVTESVRDVEGHVLKSVSYTVSSSATSSTGDPGSVGVNVEKQGKVTVAFKDAYEKATGKLVLKKTIKGSVTKEEAEGALTFTVTDETGNSTDYTLKDFKYDEKTGEFTLELTEEVGEYTVTESVKDIEGHILQSVTYTLNNGTETNGDSVKAEVKQDKTTTVVFKDDYIEEDKTGTLVLKKTIKGAITKEEAEGALDFTVKNNTTKEEKTYTLKDFKYDDKTGEFTLTLPLEEGRYTVTETTKDVDGYVLDSVTYSVDGGEATKGDSVTTDVKAKETVTVAFEDDYSKSKTESSSEQVTETTTETTIITTENITETETQTSAKSEVKTGDKAPIVLVCILLLVSAAAGGIVIGKKMKNKKDQ